MKLSKKESHVQTETNVLPLPAKKEQKLAQGKVDKELFDVVEHEASIRGVKIREVLEWGMSQWLINTNPDAAKRVKFLNK